MVAMPPKPDIRGYQSPLISRPTLMSRDLLPLYLRGLQINAALYLAGVILAGLAIQTPLAWQPAIISAGLAYLSYTCLAVGYHASTRWTYWGQVLAVASVLLALAAGVALIV
jgi:hypothetical protein